MRYMWHSTDMNNLLSIMNKGLLPMNAEKTVYLAETESDALKFSVLRGYDVTVTLKIKIYKRDEANVFETFDHSYDYFRCKAFGYDGVIPIENIIPYKYYNTAAVMSELRQKRMRSKEEV